MINKADMGDLSPKELRAYKRELAIQEKARIKAETTKAKGQAKLVLIATKEIDKYHKILEKETQLNIKFTESLHREEQVNQQREIKSTIIENIITDTLIGYTIRAPQYVDVSNVPKVDGSFIESEIDRLAARSISNVLHDHAHVYSGYSSAAAINEKINNEDFNWTNEHEQPRQYSGAVMVQAVKTQREALLELSVDEMVATIKALVKSHMKSATRVNRTTAEENMRLMTYHMKHPFESATKSYQECGIVLLPVPKKISKQQLAEMYPELAKM